MEIIGKTDNEILDIENSLNDASALLSGDIIWGTESEGFSWSPSMERAFKYVNDLFYIEEQFTGDEIKRLHEMDKSVKVIAKPDKEILGWLGGIPSVTADRTTNDTDRLA